MKESNLAFGCASIMGKYSAKQSSYILGSAYEMGVRHFDLARSYGYGAAEGFVGREFVGKSDVKISTKFGILPTRTAKIFSFAKPLARPFVKEKVPTEIRQNNSNKTIIDDTLLRESFKKSLGDLKVDRVYRLYVHEPLQPSSITQQAYESLSDLKNSGFIGNWGVSGYIDPLLKFADGDTDDLVRLYQVSANIFDFEKSASLGVDIESVFAPFHRGLVIKLLAENTSIKEFDSMPTRDAGFVALALISSLLKKRIVVSTKNSSHLKQCIEAVEYGREMDRITALNLVKVLRAKIYA